MPTSRFARLIGVPERSYRRWQQRGRQGRPAKGPWPAPSADRIEPVAIVSADRYPQWGSRTIATLLRLDGHHAPDSTVYRALRRTGRVLEVDYQAERRSLPRRGGRRLWCRPRGRTRSGSSTSASSRRGWAASGGSAVSPAIGRSSSSAGMCRQPRTTATRSRPSSSRSQRPNGCSVAACARPSSITRRARCGRSRSSPTTAPASSRVASRPSSTATPS